MPIPTFERGHALQSPVSQLGKSHDHINERSVGSGAAATTPGATRLLTFVRADAELLLPVPHSLWPFAEDLRQRVLSSLEATLERFPVPTATEVGADAVKRIAELGNVCTLIDALLADAAEFPRQPAAVMLLRTLMGHVDARCLRGADIHELLAPLADAVAAPILAAVFDARVALARFAGEGFGVDELPPLGTAIAEATTGRPAIFREQSGAVLTGLFGGQGSSIDYFDELQSLVSSYGTLVIPLLRHFGETLNEAAASPEARAAGFAGDGIDLMAWLELTPPRVSGGVAQQPDESAERAPATPVKRPSAQYMIRAPVSLPVIAAIQLTHFWLTSQLSGIPLSEFKSRFAHFAGHSQGIVGAVVAGMATSEEVFVRRAKDALTFLFWLGIRTEQAFPPMTIDPKMLQDSISHGEGQPTPMLSLRSLPTATVRKHVAAVNKHLPEERHVHVALVNSPTLTVVAGPPQSLYGLMVSLRKLRLARGADQSRTPHSQRKVAFSTSYLPVTVPFHTDYLAEVPDMCVADMQRLGISLPLSDVTTAVSLSPEWRGDLVRPLADFICIHEQRWPEAIAAPSSHLLDFGPGQSSGVGAITAVSKNGMGIQVVLAGALSISGANRAGMVTKQFLLTRDAERVPRAADWGKQYAPKVVRRECDGKLFVDTKYTRLMGKPPVMVGGMTPSTVHHDFVAACTSAGYHVELAGGGHHNEAMLRRRIEALVAQLPPGEGITVNVLFLNARQWGFQFPQLLALRREGFPIDGLCIAAGVPSMELADEVIGGLREAGLRHVAFKPGSIDAIRRVVEIAERHPSFPVLMQWTGGRAGGHHSFEDFNHPLLQTYAAIRRCDNIILVAGSGVGDAAGSLDYLTGEWSSRFGVAAMPFDAVMVASRVMVAKEGKAADAVKQAIVDAPGIEDEADWEQTYTKPAGGIITVISELGEPIHKIANRCVMLWKNFDDTLFKLPKDKLLAALRTRRTEIIRGLNADYHRVWFGVKGARREPCDVEEMTYMEVARRMVELMYISKPSASRWIDPTFVLTVADFLVRVEERFATMVVDSVANPEVLRADPQTALAAVEAAYPAAGVEPLTAEDTFFFLNLVRRRGRKPVPFVPVLDENFQTYFKKDSLWQSEDLEAVPGEDAARVCILQGPVAVRHATKVNEPVAEILDGIHEGHVAALLKRQPAPENVVFVSHSAIADAPAPSFVTSVVRGAENKTIVQLGASTPSGNDAVVAYLSFIAGPESSWLRAALTCSGYFQGKMVVENPLMRLCRPRPNQTVCVFGPAGQPVRIEFFSPDQNGSHPAVVAAFSPDTGVITVTINEPNQENPNEIQATLNLRYRFCPAQGYAPIHEDMQGRDCRVKAFYRKLWGGESSSGHSASADDLSGAMRCQTPPPGASETVTPIYTATATVSGSDIRKFCRAVGNQASMYVDERRHKVLTAPMDFGIAIGWQPIVSCILDDTVDGDLLTLVHLSNSYTMTGSRMLRQGDTVDIAAQIASVRVEATGKTVSVKAELRLVGSAEKSEAAHGKPIMVIESKFFFRGRYASSPSFQTVSEPPVEIVLGSDKDIAVMLSKPWLRWEAGQERHQRPGTRLVFRTKSFSQQSGDSSMFSRLTATGVVETETEEKETVRVATVTFDSCPPGTPATVIKTNPVMDYLLRVGKAIALKSTFQSEVSLVPEGGLLSSTLVCPLTNRPYASVSGDLNPIHVNPYFADLASLPTTITHGMWTSAACRRFVEIFAADNHPERVRFYEAKFVGFVKPGDTLTAHIFRTGMCDGRLVVRLEARNQDDDVVLKADAEIEQPPTSYVFTGQGSQEVGMGMDLYQSSSVARDIWDRADRQFLRQYGVSILEIVRKNPKELTVHFGGLNGAKIRRNYMQMTYEEVPEDGKSSETKPLFPDITIDSDSHAFVSPNGLLSATQFTQPALTLVEKAAFEDLKHKGYIQENCVFAGHSLGEYSALTAVANVLSVEALVDVVFYRGITMQLAVKRDTHGRSDFAMCAVNPLRVGKGFGELPLAFTVEQISVVTGQLLEIVNYNVENWQYVVAGTRMNLAVLRAVLDKANADGVNFEEQMKTRKLSEVKADVKEAIEAAVADVKAKTAASGGTVVLERGHATIPLQGIDVPFHSSYLYGGVTHFRTYLQKRILRPAVDVALLVGKYVPNVVAVPFSLEKAYVQRVLDATGSPRLQRALDNWHPEPMTPLQQQQLGHTLLIELLAYQFASPVRWSTTMDAFFKDFNVDRMIEVGPAPVLSGMAHRTLKLKYQQSDEATNKVRSILCYASDADAIYYTGETAVPAAAAPAAAAEPKAAAPAAPAPMAAAPAPVAAPTAAPGSGGACPCTPVVAVRTLVALKTKKPISEVATSKSIKDHSAGKSTVQNEIVGEVAKEFPGVQLEKPEETPIEELGAAIGQSKSGGVGPCLSGHVAKLATGRFPPGKTAASAKSYFEATYGVSDADGLVVHMLAVDPGARLGNEAAFNDWLDSVAQSFGTAYGKALSKGAAGGSAVPMAGMAMMAAAAATGPPPMHPEAPADPLDFIRVIVAQKAKISVDAVAVSKSLKDISAGKSTLQNELVGEMQKEFTAAGGVPDGAGETPLEEVAKAMQAKGYAALGPVSKAMVSKMVSDKMPAGTTQQSLKDQLAQRGFPTGRADSVLLFASGSQPAARIGAGDVGGFLDGAVAGYSKAHGLSALPAGGAGGAAPQGMMMMAAGQDGLSDKHKSFLMRQMELHANFIGVDLRQGARDAEAAKELNEKMAADLDVLQSELGDFFVEGVKSIFSAKKTRTFDSYWNWARQDMLELYYSIVFDRLSKEPRHLTKLAAHVINRADPVAARVLGHYVDECKQPEHPHHCVYDLAKMLLENVEEAMDEPPVYRDIEFPTAPSVAVTDAGDVVYKELRRAGIRKLEDYVAEMRRGSEALMQKAATSALTAATASTSRVRQSGHAAKEVDRRPMMKHLIAAKRKADKFVSNTTLPYLMLKTNVSEGAGGTADGRVCDRRATRRFLDAADEIARDGLTLAGKDVLVTGCGRGSIGAEILRGLLAAGARVVATTSSFSKATTTFFQQIYETHGGKGSVLHVVPFNQGSVRDIDGLMDHIYGSLKMDLDVFIPFAALPEGGRMIDGLDSRTELAHRLMLTNVYRMVGAIKKRKEGIRSHTRPAHVVVPLSPNHGVIGGDGLYGESKRSLETLFARWHSEDWANYATVLGAVIGWTRGTGLMGANNIVAEGIEKCGARTFSTQEMAFNILCLLHPTISTMSQSQPVWADFGGGLDTVSHLAKTIRGIRQSVMQTSETKKAIHAEAQHSKALEPVPAAAKDKKAAAKQVVQPRANMRFPFPQMTPVGELQHIAPLADTVSLQDVVVVTGYGEVGPWGNARTRWEMEAQGAFSLEGCIEMAWMMGLITFKNTPEYTGWVDGKSGTPVEDREVKTKYEREILEHAGIRLIEPELFDGYDPEKKKMMQQVAIDADLPPMDVSKEEAASFVRQHGTEHCDAFPTSDDGERWSVVLKRGAVLYIPKALRFDRLVAGQIPTGWDPKRFGVPDDIVNQVDPVTLFNIVSTVEALVSSGITDPYEFYKYVHITDVGQTCGGGVGGMKANQMMYRERFLDNPQVQSDVLQETFINTMPAWVNLLLLSSSGHILTPVGACATAVESVEAGVTAIRTGKAKVVIAGGYDDFGGDGSYEFASMGATSNAVEEIAKGRDPREMSRPAASSRAGFMEAQGSGSHILMTAALAVEMGVPIYGIVALVSMATDREGRSVPAPGIGLVSTAREEQVGRPQPLLDPAYRSRQVRRERDNIAKWAEEEILAGTDAEFVTAEVERKETALKRMYGVDFFKNQPRIAPIRGALSVFGLTVDDIGVASFHGTGTKANDVNESRVLNDQMSHLGRTKGNFIPSIFQKYLTGHPKGAAASWMMNGMLQCLNSGLIPGNRNADNIDAAFSAFEYVHYPSRTIQVNSGGSAKHARALRAGLLKSFGFGQVNGEVLVIHADYVLGLLSPAEHAAYAKKRAMREQASFRYMHKAMAVPKSAPFVQVKNAPPYAPEQHKAVLLDPTCRASFDARKASWAVVPGRGLKKATEACLNTTVSASQCVGVDVEAISDIPLDTESFIERNFTAAERALCSGRPDPASSFGGRWCAKEAVVKALSSAAEKCGVDGSLPGAGASLAVIEILAADTGAPLVNLHGAAADLAKKANVQGVQVSISHAGGFATSVAVAEM